MKKYFDALVKAMILSFCDIGFHRYVYSLETHKCKGIKDIKTFDFKIRECTRCGKRWILKPPLGRDFSYWERTVMEESEVLTFGQM